MNYLDLSLPAPEANLACDEALLDACENGELPSILRFWEAHDYFVALGHSNHTQQEVYQDFCRAHHIPVLRRCSGGGTVLQGPGCFNYTLILNLQLSPELANITQTNRFVMSRHRDAFTALLGKPVEIQGHTDLCLGNLKFSGNAQRRKRTHLLFHGTILLQFNLPLIEDCLRPPPRQPPYRNNRSHTDFLTCLSLAPDQIKTALRTVWNAPSPLETIPHARINQLTRQKYATETWNAKFP